MLVTLTEWATTEGIEKHARYEETQAALAAVQEKMARMEEAGTQYAAELELSRERFEKYGMLDKVVAWVEQQEALFSAGAYGDTLLETNALIEEFKGWAVQHAPKKEVSSSAQQALNHVQHAALLTPHSCVPHTRSWTRWSRRSKKSWTALPQSRSA